VHILVAAIFDAFLAIYEKRTADLLRIATSGTGILGLGAIHPDLVERLSRRDESGAARPHNVYSGARLLPAGRHYVWRVSPRHHHHRCDPGWTKSQQAATHVQIADTHIDFLLQ
jgi:hypothetical protein